MIETSTSTSAKLLHLRRMDMLPTGRTAPDRLDRYCRGIMPPAALGDVSGALLVKEAPPRVVGVVLEEELRLGHVSLVLERVVLEQPVAITIETPLTRAFVVSALLGRRLVLRASLAAWASPPEHVVLELGVGSALAERLEVWRLPHRMGCA